MHNNQNNSFEPNPFFQMAVLFLKRFHKHKKLTSPLYLGLIDKTEDLQYENKQQI